MTIRYTLVNLGERIKALRMSNKLTQTEFADRIGVTPVTVSKWEAGKTFPSKSRLLQIEDEFGRKLLDDNEDIRKKDAKPMRTVTAQNRLVDLGARIRILRTANGLTQAEFAEKCGVSRQVVCYWENGECFPTKQRMQLINEIFGVELIRAEEEFGVEMVEYKMLIRALAVMQREKLETLHMLIETLLASDDAAEREV